MEEETLYCSFCGGKLGAIEYQTHDNPLWAEYRTCTKCGYQWAKNYWNWLKEHHEREKEQHEQEKRECKHKYAMHEDPFGRGMYEVCIYCRKEKFYPNKRKGGFI
jgi:hypothetical protein